MKGDKKHSQRDTDNAKEAQEAFQHAERYAELNRLQPENVYDYLQALNRQVTHWQEEYNLVLRYVRDNGLTAGYVQRIREQRSNG